MSGTTLFSEVLSFIRKAFSDVYDFDQLMAPLPEFIEKQYGVFSELHTLQTESLEQSYIEKFYSFDSLSSKERKKTAETVKAIFIATKILLATHFDFAKIAMYDSAEQLFESYPSLREEVERDEVEVAYLLKFRNMMHLGLRLVAGRPKMLLIRACERLEGSDNIYVTGSGQKASVTRRITIYEHEGGDKLKKKKRGDEVDEELAAAIESGKKLKEAAVVEATTTIVNDALSFDEILKLNGFSELPDFGAPMRGASFESNVESLLMENYAGSFTADLNSLGFYPGMPI